MHVSFFVHDWEGETTFRYETQTQKRKLGGVLPLHLFIKARKRAQMHKDHLDGLNLRTVDLRKVYRSF